MDDDTDDGGKSLRASRESSSARAPRGYANDEIRDIRSARSAPHVPGGASGPIAGERKSRPAAPRSDDEEDPVPPPVIKNPRKQGSDPPPQEDVRLHNGFVKF